MTSFLIFLGILAVIVFWGIGMYNRLINERNRVKNAFAQIDVQLTRRYDLIPNLVEAVKGYMKHERETLENVIKARNAAASSLDAAKKVLSGTRLEFPSVPPPVAALYAECFAAAARKRPTFKRIVTTLDEYIDGDDEVVYAALAQIEDSAFASQPASFQDLDTLRG